MSLLLRLQPRELGWARPLFAVATADRDDRYEPQPEGLEDQPTCLPVSSLHKWTGTGTDLRRHRRHLPLPALRGAPALLRRQVRLGHRAGRASPRRSARPQPARRLLTPCQ